MNSAEWIAEKFTINGITYPLQISQKVYRRFNKIWYGRKGREDVEFNIWQQQIGQFYEYNSADLPQFMLSLPCVYILFNNDKVVYIGQTKCLGERIKGHKWKEYNYAQIIVCPDWQTRSNIEKYLIESRNPIYNHVYNTQLQDFSFSLVDYSKEYEFMTRKYSKGDKKSAIKYREKCLLRERIKRGTIAFLKQAQELAQTNN